MPNKKSVPQLPEVDTLTGGDDVRVASMLNLVPDGEYAGAALGSDGNDTIQFSGIIFGLGGQDALGGEDSNDTIFAGKGNDNVSGGRGNDFLRGDLGEDTIDGGEGNDSIHGGKGNDVISGGEGSDTLSGDQGSDTIVADREDSVVITGDEGDVIFAQEGTRISGYREGVDTLSGGNFVVENGVVRQVTAPTPVIPVIPSIPTPIVPSIPTPVVPVISDTLTGGIVNFPGATTIAQPTQIINAKNGTPEIIQLGNQVAVGGTNPIAIRDLDPEDKLVIPVSGGRTIVNQYFPPGSTGAINSRVPEGQGINVLRSALPTGRQDAIVATVRGPELLPGQFQTFVV